MIDEHTVRTFKDVFEEEIDRNGPDINENCRFWLGKLPMIIEALEAELEARLRGLEWQLLGELGLKGVNGGFVRAEVVDYADVTRDKLFYRLAITHGVQSDCEDRRERVVAWMDPVTMEVSYEDV